MFPSGTTCRHYRGVKLIGGAGLHKQATLFSLVYGSEKRRHVCRACVNRELGPVVTRLLPDRAGTSLTAEIAHAVRRAASPAGDDILGAKATDAARDRAAVRRHDDFASDPYDDLQRAVAIIGGCRVSACGLIGSDRPAARTGLIQAVLVDAPLISAPCHQEHCFGMIVGLRLFQGLHLARRRRSLAGDHRYGGYAPPAPSSHGFHYDGDDARL